MRIPSGVSDQYIYFVAVDATDFTTRETGLTGFTVYRSRDGAAAAAMTTPTINETDSINMPGVYELLLDEDMTIGAGNDTEEMCFHITASGMHPVTRTIELYRTKITTGNTLDVTATGAAGIDWGNVENASTPVDLSATSLSLCDTVTDVTNEAGVIASGTAQAVTGTTIQLASAETFADDELVGATVVISGGSTGVGQARVITDYVGATDTATVDTWTTTPTGTVTYQVFATAPASATSLASVNVTQWDGAAVATPTQAGVPEVDVTFVSGAAEDIATATSVSALNDISTAQVNAEVLDVLNVDTFGEPSGVPAATDTLATKLGYLYMALRNRVDVTATKKTFYDDGGVGEWEKDLSDDGTTYSESEGNAI
jgi:hypothetical protein